MPTIILNNSAAIKVSTLQWPYSEKPPCPRSRRFVVLTTSFSKFDPERTWAPSRKLGQAATMLFPDLGGKHEASRIHVGGVEHLQHRLRNLYEGHAPASHRFRYGLLILDLTTLAASALKLSTSRSETKVLPVELPVAPVPNGIITLKNRTLSPAARLFIEYAREVAKPLAKVKAKTGSDRSQF